MTILTELALVFITAKTPQLINIIFLSPKYLLFYLTPSVFQFHIDFTQQQDLDPHWFLKR